VLLHERRFIAYLVWVLIALAAYTIVRYYNHVLQEPDIYTYVTRSGSELVKVSLKPGEIMKSEVLKGTQFILISLAYQSILDRIVTERRISGLEREKLSAELAMLRYQLNPHFLFNTINDIYYLALIRSEQTAEALLELSELLRYVLHEKGDWVGLDLELDNLRRFVNLHRFRFPDCVVRLDVESSMDPEAWSIPPLVLMSYTENAFKHGEQGSESEPMRILVRIDNGRLRYEVRNRIGNAGASNAHKGIGLMNLQTRLELLFPGDHTLQTVRSEDNLFVAMLDIPLQRK
jgi:LytS/YehU family sensor histidine kinase